MPGSLLTPHDALSERSEASYGSADSRVSAKKVSFNRAVRVKQYPWTPDDNYAPEDGATHLSLPSRRFWFKVYKVKPQQVQNGDLSRDQNGSTYNGHYSQTTNSWQEDRVEEGDTYDSLAPIVEDDGTDHDDKSRMHDNRQLAEQHRFPRSQVKDLVSKFTNEAMTRKENGTVDSTHGYTTYDQPLSSSKETTTKNHMLNGFKAVLAKSQAKLRGERKDTSGKTTQQNDTKSERYNYRETSAPKQTGHSNPSYTRNANLENFAESNDKSTFPIKIPRAESPRRGRDNFERFSIRYMTNERRSRSTDAACHSEAYTRQMVSTDKSVSTDDLDISGHHDKGTSPWTNRINKDKSTQCNGTLLRSKPLASNGTPRLARSTFSSAAKREHLGDKKISLSSQNNNFRARCDASANSTRSHSLTGRSADDNNHKCGRSSSNTESTRVSPSSEASKSVHHIITKPRIATNSNRSQSNKGAGPPCKPQEPTSLNSGVHPEGMADVKSAGLYERGRGSNVVTGESSFLKHNWNNTPLVERRASSWERSVRPTAATVGYQSGRYVTSQRLRGVGVAGTFESMRNVAARVPPKATERTRFASSTRDSSRPPLHGSESALKSREVSSSIGLLKNSSGPTAGDTQAVIDWSQSGFQLGPPTVDRGLVSDSECFVHHRQPLLMYIPGVSHHEKPALEDDRMSGISGISRADMEDDLKPISGASNSHVFDRRNSMPKDRNKSWVKWKVGGKPSRQP